MGWPRVGFCQWDLLGKKLKGSPVEANWKVTVFNENM